MKKSIPVVILILFIGAAFILLRPSSKVTPSQKNVTAPTTAQATREKTYVLSDLAAHAAADNCWLAIDGGVYNVTSFIQGNLHPGGEAIVRGCGKDASQMFGRHSDRARSMLPEYKVGILTQ